ILLSATLARTKDRREAEHRARGREPEAVFAWSVGPRDSAAGGARLALGVALVPVALRAPARLDLHVEDRVERVDSVLQVVAGVDVLPVAEERSGRLRAVRLAPALEVGFARRIALRLTRELAIEVGLGFAAALAARLALGLARRRGRRPFALSVAAP